MFLRLGVHAAQAPAPSVRGYPAADRGAARTTDSRDGMNAK